MKRFFLVASERLLRLKREIIDDEINKQTNKEKRMKTKKEAKCVEMKWQLHMFLKCHIAKLQIIS